MTVSFWTRLTGTVLLAFGLSGCIDVNMEVAILDEDNARATTTITMDRSMYEMVKAQSEDGTTDFCEEEDTIKLREDEVDCINVVEGDFASVIARAKNDDQPKPSITNLGSKQVKVTFPTSSLNEEINSAELGDAETRKMMAAMFTGHSVKLTISGGTIVDTNMETASDGHSASLTIPLDTMLNGTMDLPDESFAIVQLD